MLNAQDSQYVIALLNQRIEQVRKLENAIKAMGDHAFINDGLLNEGALKLKTLTEESQQIQRIIQVLAGE